jgi:PleD family two-component response regulator
MIPKRHPSDVPANFRGSLSPIPLMALGPHIDPQEPYPTTLVVVERYTDLAELNPPLEEVPVKRTKPMILAVDDESINLELLASAFEDEYEVMFATSGQQALSLAARHLPDVVLLDLMMPRMDGFDVCAGLKARPATSRIPVMFITGLGDTAFETIGLELGAVDFISKPINPMAVRARVHNVIQIKLEMERLRTSCEMEQSLRADMLEEWAMTSRGKTAH